MNCRGRDQLRAGPSSRPRRRRSSLPSPFSRARASTACTSRAKPRVPTRRRSDSRPPHRLGASSVQQLAQHDVLLGRGQQPQRGGVERRPGRSCRTSAVGEGVERRAQRGRHRAAEPGGDPVAQLLGGLAAEGQREHRARARRRGARCGRRSPRPAWWSCRCRARRAPAAARPRGRRPTAGTRRGRAPPARPRSGRRGGTSSRGHPTQTVRRRQVRVARVRPPHRPAHVDLARRPHRGALGAVVLQRRRRRGPGQASRRRARPATTAPGRRTSPSRCPPDAGPPTPTASASAP